MSSSCEAGGKISRPFHQTLKESVIMFCPKCQAEYREGFTTCSDCNVALVDALYPEPETSFADYEEVLATYNQGDIVTIKSIFEKEDIAYFVKGEMFTGMGAFIDPARVMVMKDHVELARLLLKDLDLAYAGINIRDDEDIEKT